MPSPFLPSKSFVLKCKSSPHFSTYLNITNPQGKSRILAFDTSTNAKKCKNYIDYFTKRFNEWPSFDMSDNTQLIIPKPLKSIEYITDDITIEDIDLLNFCSMHNYSSFYCTNFDYSGLNKIEITIQGIEYSIDDEDGIDFFRNNLNSLK